MFGSHTIFFCFCLISVEINLLMIQVTRKFAFIFTVEDYMIDFRRSDIISFLSIAILTSFTNSAMSSSSSKQPIYNLRRYQPSDKQGIKDLFTANIEEEWGTRYHEGKYIDNARRYIDSVVCAEDSDLNNIETTYFVNGGYFYVLTCSFTSDGEDEYIVVGTCGLQRISDTEAELRRVCISKDHRSMGWGSKMVKLLMDRVKTHEEMANINKVVVSTIQHSVDGIDFYKTKHGFVDTIDKETGQPKTVKAHGTPINEVFMECKMDR